jgi:hypothetical protein
MPKVMLETTKTGSGFLKVNGMVFGYVPTQDEATDFEDEAEAQAVAAHCLPPGREFIIV